MNRRTFLKGSAAACVAMAGASATAAAGKPNIVFILTDDQGLPTLGCYGCKDVPTPHTDRLAAEGMRFTDAYVQPQCTPTRASLLTGQHTARNKLWHVIGWYGYPWARVTEPPYALDLPRETFTIAKGLKAAGYATGQFGKWHLNTNQDTLRQTLNPEAAAYYGFDYAAPPVPREQFDVPGADRGVNFLTDEAIAFIEKNKERPFFCYLAHHMIHNEVVAPMPLVQKYRAKGYPEKGLFNATYLAALEHLDASVGRLMARLDELGLRENTLVVYLSDNGGIDHRVYFEPYLKPKAPPHHLEGEPLCFDNSPLREGKGSMYEGGIRVPCIVRWPGETPRGSHCETPIQVVDWMPTLLEIAGGAIPQDHAADGVSLAPLLRGGSIAERGIYWYLPLYDIRWKLTPCAIVRRGDYKLIEFFGDYVAEDGNYHLGKRLELYNVRSDIGESGDLAARMPEKVKALQAELHAWMASVPVDVPAENPHYDPERSLMETREQPEWVKAQYREL